MGSGKTFDDEKTIFISPQSEEKEEKLLFFLEDDPGNKLSVTSEKGIVVGRSIESDFFVENKTVSRKHLGIKRNRTDVVLEIFGRNGLYLNGELHTGPVLSVNPPISFTIGDVACCLEFEGDEDQTLLVNRDQRAGMVGGRAPSPQNTPPPACEPPTPFDPSPRDTFIPAYSRAHEPQSPNEYSPVGGEKGNTPSPDPLSDHSVPRRSSVDFDPVPKTTQGNGTHRQGKGARAFNKNKLIISAIAVLSVLITIFIIFLLFSDSPDQTVKTPVVSQPQPPSNTAAPASGTRQETSHQAFIDLAKTLIQSGDTVTARDVLSDIPKTSPYYSQAKELLDQLPEN